MLDQALAQARTATILQVCSRGRWQRPQRGDDWFHEVWRWLRTSLPWFINDSHTVLLLRDDGAVGVFAAPGVCAGQHAHPCAGTAAQGVQHGGPTD